MRRTSRRPASAAAFLGRARLALRAGPLSPVPGGGEKTLPAAEVMISVLRSTCRMRKLKVSAIKRFCWLSNAMPAGKLRLPLVAGPISPKEKPPPTTVLIVAVGVPGFTTLRMRLLKVSAINRLPAPSTATPDGKRKLAPVAGPPSPLRPAVPLPATVEMFFVAASTRLMRSLRKSAIKRLPSPSTAILFGKTSLELVAGPLSPKEEPPPARVHDKQVAFSINRYASKEIGVSQT